jgi:hypothetical protein
MRHELWISAEVKVTECITVSARDISQLEWLAWITKDSFIGKFAHASQIKKVALQQTDLNLVIRGEPKHSTDKFDEFKDWIRHVEM